MQPTVEEIKREVAWQLAGINQNTVTLFDNKKDDELFENYTINFFPDKVTAKMLEEFSELSSIEKDLCYLDKEKWHITLVGEISTNVESREIVELVGSLLVKNKISFEINGFASNKSTASFLAYPTFDLHQLREHIRTGLGAKGTDYTTHLSVYEYIGWINFVRYTTVPGEEFLRKLREGLDTDFGTLNSGRIRLLKNRSRLLRDGKYEVVHEF